MLAPTTARDQIHAALRLIGQLAEGEVPSAAVANDALEAMNQMIDSWSTEALSIFATEDQVCLWPANVAERTLGPTGDFVGHRPLFVEAATYFRDPTTGVSYGIKMVNQEQYNGIALKTVRSTYPQVMWVNMTFPNIHMRIYPVPLRDIEFHIVCAEPLQHIHNLSEELLFPSGYLRAFKYNLAMELAPEFGVEPSPQVKRIAMISKRNLKRVNASDLLMALPYSIVGTRQRYNIFAGNY